MRRFFLMMALAAGLVACGPQFQTTYRYVPPNTQTGQMCVMQCLQMQGQCHQMAAMEIENCRRFARQEANVQYWMHVHEHERRHQPPRHNVDWFDNSYRCQSNQHQCQVQYHTCYAGCGGQVLSETRCVSGCSSEVQAMAPAVVNPMPRSGTPKWNAEYAE